MSIVRTPTAVILAAGRGTRMAGATGGKPKGFLPANDKTFVSRAIDILRAEGVADIVIVTGFGAPLYDELAATYGFGVRTVFNPEFATKGTMRSLLAAIENTDAPLLILDGDIVFEKRAVRLILQDPLDSAIVLSGIGTLGDEFYAWTSQAGSGPRCWLKHLSKYRSDRSDPPDGEHMGIIKLGKALVEALRCWVEQNPTEADTLPYELCLLPMLAEHSMAAVHIPDLIWTEVDTPAMLHQAQTTILPKLAAEGD